MITSLIPKAYAGHHPGMVMPGEEIQAPAAAPPPSAPPATTSSSPPVLLIAGILLAICIGGWLLSMRKK